MTQDRRNQRNAWGYFVTIGKIPKDATPNEWCLHHIDTTLKYTNPNRYAEWRVEDLQPMTKADHCKLHHAGRPKSEEHKQKISDALKGHEVNDATRAKISEACKGKTSWLKGTHGCIVAWNKGIPATDESKRKNSEAHKGRKWWNDGKTELLVKECPGNNYILGRLKR